MEDTATDNTELAELRRRKIIDLQTELHLQQEIGKLNAKLAAIVESSDDAIIGKDLNGTITSWNRGAERIFGYSVEEAIGRPISMLVPPGHSEELRSILEMIMKGERVEHYETFRVTKAAEQITVSLTISPIRDAAGTIIGASTISRDITRRKKYEAVIQRQARMLDQIQESVITTDFAGNVTSWNKGAERMFLYTEKEAMGKHISFIYPKDQAEFLEHNVIEPLKEKGLHESEVLLRKKSGEEFHALLLLTKQINGNGVVTGLIGSSVDITALKKAEDIIRHDKEDWEQTFDAIPDIVTVIDNQNIIRKANKALTAKLGVARNELIGKECYKTICGIENPLPNCTGRTAIVTCNEQMEDKYIDYLKGHYLISCTPLHIRDGNISGFVEVFRDISRQKQLERKLDEAANTDDLTGLYNRRGFTTLAEHRLLVADREKKTLILMYVDLNDMKNINDKFGHEEGDRALVDTANLLRKSFRESDVLGRLGGDEFAVLLTEPPEKDIEQVLCEHIQQNLNSHNAQSGRPYLLSVSIGIAHHSPDNHDTLRDLLTMADKRMYVNKEQLKMKRET